MRRLAAILVPLAGCSPGIEGVVHDAGTGRPVANARVEISTSGWGRRNGQLVWDKEYRYAALSGPDGKFVVKGVDGGYRLSVQARRFPALDTSLCSRSPMTVRVGGPFQGIDLSRQLRLGTTEDGGRQGWRFAPPQPVASAEADLFLVSLTDETTATLSAPRGMIFVAGTGNPPAPPQSGHATKLRLDLLQCGWLFVRFDGGVAAVRIGNMAIDQPLEGGRYLMMSYGIAPSP